MSSLGAAVRKKAYDRQYRKDHPPTEEQKARHAAHEREVRREERVRKSLEHDALLAAEKRASRATKRLSAIASTHEDLSDEEEEDDRDNEGVDDDFDEAPTDDDNEEAGEWSDERVRTVYERARQDDRYMHGECGGSVAQFDDVVERTRDELAATRYDGGKRVQTMHRAQRLNDTLQMFILLIWLWQVGFKSLFAHVFICRKYRTYRQMAHCYDLPKKYLVKIIYRCCVALHAVAQQTPHADGGIAKPTLEQLKAVRERCAGIAQYGLENYVIAIDGIIVRTAAPPRELQAQLRPLLWNAHYRHWGFTVLVMCDLRGMSVWTSSALMCDEQTAANDEGVKMWLRDMKSELGVDVGYLSDSLYSFNKVHEPSGEHVLHMWSMGPGTLKAVKRLAFDHDIEVPDDIRADAVQALYTSRYVAQLRAVEENHNRELRRFAILGNGAVFRGRLFSPRGVGKYMPTPTMIVDNIAFLVNRKQVLGKPLRAVGWRPKTLLLGGVPPPQDFKCGYPNFGAKTPMVNRSRMQKRIPEVLKQYLPQSKQTSANAKKTDSDDDDDEDDDFDDDDFILEERGDYVYDVLKRVAPVELTRRQRAVVENRGKKLERFAVADDALATAERAKRKK